MNNCTFCSFQFVSWQVDDEGLHSAKLESEPLRRAELCCGCVLYLSRGSSLALTVGGAFSPFRTMTHPAAARSRQRIRPYSFCRRPQQRETPISSFRVGVRRLLALTVSIKCWKNWAAPVVKAHRDLSTTLSASHIYEPYSKFTTPWCDSFYIDIFKCTLREKGQSEQGFHFFRLKGFLSN